MLATVPPWSRIAKETSRTIIRSWLCAAGGQDDFRRGLAYDFQSVDVAPDTDFPDPGVQIFGSPEKL